MRRFFVGITGASGSLYGLKLISELASYKNNKVYVSITPDGETNLKIETGIEDLDEIKSKITAKSNVEFVDYRDFAAPVSSGSFKVDSYIIIPASMGCIGRIASGVSSNLIERCADVALKERRKLVIVFREAPLNTIHLKNLLELSRAGAIILPAAPAFYHEPKSIDDLIDFIVGKIFDIINIEHSLFKRWN
ncbi:MAG: UbiX family flavin prenyltransferase [Deferribacterales bacterium]|jgi:4-hydroxy-3-polyprenylbenzoate decarboxylase|nr:UbiX family flavin prenyltransferase [Deferribacterales bacterium]MBZ4672115.1 UbiX family flavin prenyltransferase [Deferribacteraceae bacterium]